MRWGNWPHPTLLATPQAWKYQLFCLLEEKNISRSKVTLWQLPFLLTTPHWDPCSSALAPQLGGKVLPSRPSGPLPKPPLNAGARELLLCGPHWATLQPFLLCPPCNGSNHSKCIRTKFPPRYTPLSGLKSPIKIPRCLFGIRITQSKTKPPQQAWIPSPGLPPPSPATMRQHSALRAFLAHLGLGHPSPDRHCLWGGSPSGPLTVGQPGGTWPGQGSGAWRGEFTYTHLTSSQAGGSEVVVNWAQARGRECAGMALGTLRGERGRRQRLGGAAT